MQIIYCKKCNHFSFQSRMSNYCKVCNTPVMNVDVSPEEFYDMPINERYRLAYKLSNEDEKER